jgi:hypothetical protein
MIYHLSSNFAQKLKKYDSALAFAGIIIEIGKEQNRIHQVVNSSLSTSEKCGRELRTRQQETAARKSAARGVRR